MANMVICPSCKQLEGPLVNNFLDHMRDAHNTTAAFYSANTGMIQLPGGGAVERLEFINIPDEDDEPAHCPECEGANLDETHTRCFDCSAQDYA
jgi:hypothetical protein